MLEVQRADVQVTPTAPLKRTVDLDLVRDQMNRILASNTFHNAEVLRRLLKFLAEKTLAGEADSLKEYSVGLDALGKPATYDPRQDAAVRLQASRLRIKLDQYYRAEGSDDPLIIELPKGRFKLGWRLKDTPTPGTHDVRLASPVPVSAEPHDLNKSELKKWRSTSLALACICLVLVFLNAWSVLRLARLVKGQPTAASTPELDAFWGPFLSSPHHVVLAFSNPLFVRFQRKGQPDIVYREREMTGWSDAIRSPDFALLNRTLGNPSATPSENFVERSNLVSTFVLSQFFARRRSDVSLVRVSDLSWQQFAEDNVVLLGNVAKIAEKQSALPVTPAFSIDQEGVRNLQPLNGEQAVYADAQDHQESDGEGLELISMLPGPLGRTTVASFAGNHVWGTISSLKALTDATFAGEIVRKLRGSRGKFPAYYQLVIKLRYRDGIPTNAAYITHRVLSLTDDTANLQQ